MQNKLDTLTSMLRRVQVLRLTQAILLLLALSVLLGFSGLRLNAQTFPVIKTINVDISPFGCRLSRDGGTVWVANSGSLYANSHFVTIIDVATLSEEPGKISVGLFPEDIDFGLLGLRAFVTNSTDSTVSVIDTTTRTVTQTISMAPVPMNFPFGIVVTADDRKAYVTTDGDFNRVGILDNGLIVTLDPHSILLPGPSARPALRPAHTHYEVAIPTQAADGTAELVLVNPDTNTVVASVELPGDTAETQGVAVTPDGHYAYVSLLNFSGGTGGGVWVIDLETLTTVTLINTGDQEVFGIRITHNGKYVFATNFINNTVAVINTATNTVIDTTPVGRQPNDIAFTLDDRLAFVTNQNDTTVSVIRLP
jgi:YVTN family beta-propeller protein